MVKPRKNNQGPDYLSQIETGEELDTYGEVLPGMLLFQIIVVPEELDDIAILLSTRECLRDLTPQDKQSLAWRATPYTLIEGELHHKGNDDMKSNL